MPVSGVRKAVVILSLKICVGCVCVLENLALQIRSFNRKVTGEWKEQNTHIKYSFWSLLGILGLQLRFSSCCTVECMKLKIVSFVSLSSSESLMEQSRMAGAQIQ